MNVWVLNPPFLKKYSRPQRSPAVTKSGTIYFPIWLAYCAGVLEQDGHVTTVTDAPAGGYDTRDIVRTAQRLTPRLIVMDTSTPSIDNDIGVAERLKAAVPRSFIVLVGTHVSACAEEVLLQSTAVDAIARREYEYTVRELARLLARTDNGMPGAADLEAVAGLSFRTTGGVKHTDDRPYIENLDELPWVSRVYKRHLDYTGYFNPNALYPMVTLITSRGCPFRCSFCVYPQTLTGRRYRFRSIDDVVGEMEFIAREFPDVKCIFFEDDTLTANKKRCIALADAVIRRGVRIPWTANSRIDLDRETMQKLKAAGCRELCVGFESGEQEILNVMQKGTKLPRMFRFMEDARAAGLLIHGCFMVGFPGETRRTIHKTIDLALRLSPDTVQFYPVMVYPGTEAYEQYRRQGWLTTQDYRQWITREGLHNCVVRNETLTPPELVRLCDLGRRKFYLRPRYIMYKLYQLIKKPSEIGRTLKAARTFFKHLVMGSGV